MKHLNKLFLLIFVLAFAIGCSKSSDPAPAIVGKWKASTVKGSATVLGQTQAINEAIDATFEFKADNTFTTSGTINALDTDVVNKTSVSGKYTFTGSEVTMTYTDPSTKKETVETYKVTVSGSTMTWNLNLDAYKKLAANDPNSALLLAFISALDLNITLQKQ
jgi:hypothetical protein